MNTLVALPIAGALPLVMAIPDAAAAPTAVVSADPIFALIEAYRAAAKTHAAACSEFSRREEMLIEQGWGLGPFISVLDVSGSRAPHPVLVYKHKYVDVHVAPDRFPEVNAAAHASLDAKFEQHKAILGDTEKVMYAAMDAETEALDELVWTVPTSIAGVLALLELGPGTAPRERLRRRPSRRYPSFRCRCVAGHASERAIGKRGDGMMDRDAIDLALHEIQQMVEVSIRAAERLQGVEEDERVSRMPRADHELLDFSPFDLARRVKASREMLFEGDRPVTVKPVLSIVRDQA